MPGENETVYQISVPGGNEAVELFERLAAARERAAAAGAGVSGGAMFSAPGTPYGGAPSFGGAPPAPGTTGSPQGNNALQTGAMNPVGGFSHESGGGLGNASSITINTPHVTIYAQSVSQVGGASPGIAASAVPTGNIPATSMMMSAPGTPYAQPSPGAAPPAPGTGGGLWNTIQSFFGGLGGGGNTPWGGGGMGVVQAALNSGSIGGLAQTFGSAIPGIGAVMLAGNTMAHVAGAAYASSQPGYQLETQMMTAAASGQYINPAQSAAMQRAAAMRGDTEYWRSMVGLVGWVPGANLAFESYYGRDADRAAAIEEARGGRDARSLMAGAVLGRSRRYDDDMYGEASFNLLMEGSNFGAGGAAVGDRFNLQRLTARNGGNLGAASSYASALMGFASQPQYGFLPSLVNGSLDLGSLQNMFIQAAASRGDFGALGTAVRGGARVGRDAFDIAADTSLGNTNIALGGLGLGYTSSMTSFMGATGSSASAQAALIEQNVPRYADQQLAEISRQKSRETDPVRYAQLVAQEAQVAAQREQALLGARRMIYGEEQGIIQTGIGGVNLSIQRGMFGTSESAVSGGYGGLQTGAHDMAALYSRMARESRFSPEERARYALMAGQQTFEAEFGIPRQEGQFRQGMAMGRIGVDASIAGYRSSQASLFGGIGDIYGARLEEADITRQQRGVVAGQLNGEYGPVTMQERLQLQERLNQLIRQESEQRESAVRGLGQMQIALAQTAQGIVGTQQSRAYMTGVGGVEGFGYASRSSGAAQATLGRAEDYVRLLQSRGVADSSPEMQRAVASAEEARTAFTQSEISATQVPFSLGLRQAESRERFGLQALSMFPGQYGSMRALLGKQMGTQEHMAQEITQRREAHRAQYGGQLPEHLEYEYEQQLQRVALQQGQTFQQLSYGWESRLQSQMLGAPGSMAFITPSLSFRAAIGSGVSNPHMGANSEEVPFFLRQAMLASSIAGATGTPEGFAVTAMTGARAQAHGGANPLDGARIVLEMPLPGGGHASVPATVTTRSTAQDTSPGAVIESSRRNMTAPHQ